MSDKLIKIFVSFFYIGEVPWAPGTVASLAAVLLYAIVQPVFLIYFVLLLSVTVLGLFWCTEAERIYGHKDPSGVVIDEVAGMLLACFLMPLDAKVLFVAFVLFRFFDITKIYPINKLEKCRGGLGIMMDDIMAGIYTNMIMHVAMRWLKIV